MAEEVVVIDAAKDRQTIVQPVVGHRMVYADRCVVEVEQLFCRMGSFLKAYEPGDSNYNVDSGRGPASLGWVSVDLHLKRDRSKDGRGLWIDKTATVH